MARASARVTRFRGPPSNWVQPNCTTISGLIAALQKYPADAEVRLHIQENFSIPVWGPYTRKDIGPTKVFLHYQEEPWDKMHEAIEQDGSTFTDHEPISGSGDQDAGHQ